MYNLAYEDKTLSYLDKLPKKIRERIVKKIITAKKDPLRYFFRLKENKSYKLRVGEYRVIADIHQDIKVIHISLIGHRKNIYEKNSP